VELMKGKRIVVLGVANHRSIAWAIAKQLHGAGAELAFNFLGDKLEKRVRPLAEEVGSPYIAPCDVSNDESIQEYFSGLKKVWGKFDGLVHSIAFAGAEDLHGNFIDVSRKGYALALDISSFSLNALVRIARPQFNENSAVLAMTYDGAHRIIKGYHLMGVAKAALECGIRYLADDLGPEKIRVNGISAGPIRTLAASGVKGFSHILDIVGKGSPLKRNVEIEEVGKAALYLLSDLSSGVTGEIHYVDCGFHHIGGSSLAQMQKDG